LLGLGAGCWVLVSIADHSAIPDIDGKRLD
jgi:hypothetical protein